MSDMDLEAFESLANDLRAMPARIKRAKEAEQAAVDAANRQLGKNAAERVAHEKWLADLTAAHEAKCAERERSLANREAGLVERETAVQEKAQRAEATMRAAEARAADLSNRLHGHAA